MSTIINAVAKRYRYTGKERDEETGLYYHGARYYIPWLARWTATDPLEAKFAGRTPYCYSANNPVVFNDPDDMQETPAGKQTDLGGVNYKQPEQARGYSAKDPAGRSMFLPENISISEDSRTLFAKGENRTWDLGSWNEELGDYEFNKHSSEFELPDFDTSSNKDVSYATFAAGALILGGTASVVALGIAILATAAILLTVAAVLDYRANSKSEPISKPVAVPVPDVISKPKNEEGQTETFYRAMSDTEYKLTGGLLKHRLNNKGEYKGAGPFITDRLEYAKSTQKFGSGKYDFIIEYTVLSGTKDYLRNVSLKHPQDFITKIAIKLSLPVMKEERGGYNFGFPGESGDLHFNYRIINIRKINF